MDSKRMIRVQGRATVAAEPDLAVLTFEVEAKNRDYEHCVTTLNQRVENLRREIEMTGVERKRLKTTQFGVDTDYEWVNNSRVFNGYKAKHHLRLELPLERELLNQVVGKVAESVSEAEMDISFGVKDEAALKQRVLEAAVAMARQNADTLARAAGVTLGEILDIEYGWTEVHFRSEFRVTDAMACCEAAPDFEPMEVEAEDTVTVVWGIS
jgi:uncharacterized protein